MSNYVPPKRGNQFWEEVCTPEYLQWMERWSTLTTEQKIASVDRESIEWHDNEAVLLIRLASAFMKKAGIQKYKPEYTTRAARDRVKNGYYTDTMTRVVSVPTSLFSGDGDDDDISDTKLHWPDAPLPMPVMVNFDEPSWFADMSLMVGLGRHISIEGPPSIGKDTAVEQLAAMHQIPLVVMGGDAGFRTRDLVGSQQIANGASYFDVADYAAAAVNGWWVLLTEVNAADPSAIMFINRQLAAPYVVNFAGRSFPVHQNFRLFVTYNHGLIGTKPLPQSFKDRFFSIRESFFTETQLRKRLEAMGWSMKPEHEMANSIIVDFGMAMWSAHERGLMRYQITVRRLKDAVDLVVVGGRSVKSALKAAVLASIDSPVEYKAAENVLNTVC